MIEVTDEMVEAAADAIARCNGRFAGSTPTNDHHRREARSAIAAVAPLIKAQTRAEIERLQYQLKLHAPLAAENAALRADLVQARAEIERKDRALERLGYAARTGLEGQVELAADLAQARAAAIEEAYNEAELWGANGDALAAIDRLCSRPVSEREGADTAPAPAISGGEMVSREIAVGLWDLLDEIDTISDLAKGDDKLYRQLVEKAQRRRFQFGSTDGYSVLFAALAAADRGASQ